jgi:putative membrane protein
MGWGWSGMWFGPLVMLVSFGLLVAFIVGLVRWIGVDRGATTATALTPREVLDARYARGEIDREE